MTYANGRRYLEADNQLMEQPGFQRDQGDARSVHE